MLICYAWYWNRKGLIVYLRIIFFLNILISLIEEIMILFYFILFKNRIACHFKIIFNFLFGFNFFCFFHIKFLWRNFLNCFNCGNFLRGWFNCFCLLYFFLFFFTIILKFILIRRYKLFFYNIVMYLLLIFLKSFVVLLTLYYFIKFFDPLTKCFSWSSYWIRNIRNSNFWMIVPVITIFLPLPILNFFQDFHLSIKHFHFCLILRAFHCFWIDYISCI